MNRLAQIAPQPDWKLWVVADDGHVGHFDVRPYLQMEAFEALNDISDFMKIKNGGYFVEWECCADWSADTIAAKLVAVRRAAPFAGTGSAQAV